MKIVPRKMMWMAFVGLTTLMLQFPLVMMFLGEKIADTLVCKLAILAVTLFVTWRFEKFVEAVREEGQKQVLQPLILMVPVQPGEKDCGDPNCPVHGTAVRARMEREGKASSGGPDVPSGPNGNLN